MLTDSSETSVDKDAVPTEVRADGRGSAAAPSEQPVLLRRWALYDSRLDFKKG